MPGAAVGKRAEKATGVRWKALPLFPLIFGVREIEVVISGLHRLHRNNLEPLQIEDPTQESRDKGPTASLVLTGPTGHSAKRPVGPAAAASTGSK